MKYVYIVNGEHDGFLGAFSNFKKGSLRAREYAAGCEWDYNTTNVITHDESNEWISFYEGSNTSNVERTIVE